MPRSAGYGSVVDDEHAETKPGNWYEEFLWDLAGGPVAVGPIIVVWLLLLALAAGVLALAAGLTERSFLLACAVVSGPYFFIGCPIWARRIGRRRDGGE